MARPVDTVHIGDANSETAHALDSDRSRTGDGGEPFPHWRDAEGFFSYVLLVPSASPASLRCVYWGSDTGRTFDIFVDGTKIATQTLTGARPGEYLPVTYPLLPALTRGKEAITVRFQPHAGGLAGGLFDLRVVR